MPFVVVDTNVSLPATLSATGLTRKFWILLAYGAATYRAEHLDLELDVLAKEAAATGGTIGGQDTLARAAEQAEHARAQMEELLPLGTPSDWVAIGGVDLFSEYEGKVESVGAKLGLDPPPDAAASRRQLEAVCVSAAPLFDPTAVPALTPDPDDDLIVWTALRGGADFLISDDGDIVPSEAEGARRYEHGERSVVAMRFGHLVENHLDGVEWGEIDGTLLARLYRRS